MIESLSKEQGTAKRYYIHGKTLVWIHTISEGKDVKEQIQSGYIDPWNSRERERQENKNELYLFVCFTIDTEHALKWEISIWCVCSKIGFQMIDFVEKQSIWCRVLPYTCLHKTEIVRMRNYFFAWINDIQSTTKFIEMKFVSSFFAIHIYFVMLQTAHHALKNIIKIYLLMFNA